MTRRRFVAALPLVIAVSMATHAATRPSLPSAWRTSDVVVDGSDAEWTAALTPIAGSPLFASVVNDDEHVFVRLRVTERAAMEQIVRGGLLVWFDAKGGDAKTFGIKYPVSAPPPNPESDDAKRDGRPGGQGGNRGGGPGAGGPGGSGRRGTPGSGGQPPLHGARDRTEGPPPIDGLIAQIPNRLEVYGPKDDDIRSLVLAWATGLSVSVSRVEDVLVYELAVPLKKDGDHPFAIGTTAGATIGIGFQSPKIATSGPGILSNLGGLGNGMGGGRPGGGGMGGPGGGGGRMGGPPRDDPDDKDKERKPPAPPKPFTAWLTLVLAAQSPR